jgi:hypothetical protein
VELELFKGAQPIAQRIEAFKMSILDSRETVLGQSAMELSREIEEWMKVEYGRCVTPERKMREQLRDRVYSVLSWLADEVAQAMHIDPEDKTIREAICGARAMAQTVGFPFPQDPPIPPDKQKGLKPYENATVDYIAQAVRHNPVFENLDQLVRHQVIHDRYRAYVAKGRHPDEEQAYQEAMKAMQNAIKCGTVVRRWEESEALKPFGFLPKSFSRVKARQ